MGEILVIGAGITGGYNAARLCDNGADISLKVSLALPDKKVGGNSQSCWVRSDT